MSQQKVLLSINRVTDDETGLYQIVELDFSLHCSDLENYIKAYGYEGRKELMNILGTLATHVDRYFQETCVHNQGSEMKAT